MRRGEGVNEEGEGDEWIEGKGGEWIEGKGR